MEIEAILATSVDDGLTDLNAGLGAPNVAAAQWHIWDPDGEQLPVYTQLRNKPK